MLSVAIIARDEERHIAAALASVAGLADEVLVLLDARTHDATAAVASQHGARVITEPWRNFSMQRNRALELCQGDWVLFLDADERVTPELHAEVLQIVDCRLQHGLPQSAIDNLQSAIAGYWLPRQNLFFGRPVRGGGWYPDKQLRLLRRGHAHYDPARQVHELALLDGPAGELSGHLLHLNIERFDELWRKQQHYALQEAQTLYLEGRRARWRNFVGAPLREFVRRFFILGGYRDGALGLLLCGTLAFFELVKFVHLKALQHHIHQQATEDTERTEG